MMQVIWVVVLLAAVGSGCGSEDGAGDGANAGVGAAGAGSGPAGDGDTGADTGSDTGSGSDADTGAGAESGAVAGTITLDALGYDGSGAGDIWIAVMDENPTACVISGGPKPNLMGGQTIRDLDLNDGGSVDYRVERIPPGGYWVSAFLDENGNADTTRQPELGELAAVDLSNFTPRMATLRSGETTTLDRVLNFEPPPIGPPDCSPIL
ncbi:MAG: hypothetical protein PVI30_20065 [Myxococcales bacterium]|jgi:hypothetical protein